MAKIDDTGKVWVRGSFRPEYAVRVGDKFFILGKEEDEILHCWVEDDCLCADLHNKSANRRRLLRLGLSLPTIVSGTLFNGFEKTRHRDMEAVTCRDPGVEEFTVEGDAYRSASIAGMDAGSFWNHVVKEKLKIR